MSSQPLGCVSLGGSLFSAEFLGREASVVLGAHRFCVLIASLRARLRGVEFGFHFLGDCWAFVCFVGSCAEWGIAEGTFR